MKDVVHEDVLELAAVTGHTGLVGLGRLLLQETLEGFAFAPFLVSGLQLLRPDLRRQAFCVAPNRVHRLAGGHDLSQTQPLLLFGAARFDPGLQRVETVYCSGHVIGRRAGGDVILLQQMIPEQILRGPAVTGQGFGP